METLFNHQTGAYRFQLCNNGVQNHVTYFEITEIRKLGRYDESGSQRRSYHLSVNYQICCAPAELLNIYTIGYFELFVGKLT